MCAGYRSVRRATPGLRRIEHHHDRAVTLRSADDVMPTTTVSAGVTRRRTVFSTTAGQPDHAMLEFDGLTRPGGWPASTPTAWLLPTRSSRTADRRPSCDSAGRVAGRVVIRVVIPPLGAIPGHHAASHGSARRSRGAAEYGFGRDGARTDRREPEPGQRAAAFAAKTPGTFLDRPKVAAKTIGSQLVVPDDA